MWTHIIICHFIVVRLSISTKKGQNCGKNLQEFGFLEVRFHQLLPENLYISIFIV